MNELLILWEFFFNSGFTPFFIGFFAVVFIFRFFLCFERFCFGTCDEKKPKEVKPNAVLKSFDLKSFDKREVFLKKVDENE